MGTYKDLDIYSMAMELFFKVHPLSLDFQNMNYMSQLRRSADSVVSNIVEGYGRRRYKNDYIKFLVYSHASNDETLNHLEKLAIIYSHLRNEFLELHKEYDLLGGKINNFIRYIEKN